MEASRRLRIAVICEHSGVVRDAFLRRGHDAVSCDLLPTESPGPHIQGDARDQDWRGHDIIICHPECTYLCNSGVRWLHTEPGRWAKLDEAAEFFRWCLSLAESGARVAVENPVPHKYALERIRRKYDQTIQPWQFGHGETKRTCLWLVNLPKLTPTMVVPGREPRVHHASPGPDRWKARSRTYAGIAEAMAQQWGSLPPVAGQLKRGAA